MFDNHKLRDNGFEEEKRSRLKIPRKTVGPVGSLGPVGSVGIPRIPKKVINNDPIENFRI